MIRAVFWLAVLGTVIYIAYNYARPQIRAWRYHDAMLQAAKYAGDASEDEVRADLMTAARDLHVPLVDRRLEIHRDTSGRVHVAASWNDVVTLRAWNLYEWADTLDYSYEVEQEPRTTKLR
jgi:hypothetical protein